MCLCALPRFERRSPNEFLRVVNNNPIIYTYLVVQNGHGRERSQSKKKRGDPDCKEDWGEVCELLEGACSTEVRWHEMASKMGKTYLLDRRLRLHSQHLQQKIQFKEETKWKIMKELTLRELGK